MKTKYPLILPFATGFLPVGFHHEIYYEESGNPQGIPVLFLHGGPGGETCADHRCYFDPEKYRIILLDQRGCGKSIYQNRFLHNTTWDVIEDLEKLRLHLRIHAWVLFGGSWGSFLALVYGIIYPQHVLGVILRGIFLGTQNELDWLYKNGASHIHFEEWEKFSLAFGKHPPKDLVAAYSEKVFSENPAERKLFSQKWARWELINLRMQPDLSVFDSPQFLDSSEKIAQMQLHYFTQKCFLKSDFWIFENAYKLIAKPFWIIHGRYDLVSPAYSAGLLHKVLPESYVEILPLSGHSSSDIYVIDALVRATDNFASMI